MKFRLGESVKFSTRSGEKLGIVFAVVPAEENPPKVTHCSLRRTESYVILVKGRSAKYYWPKVFKLVTAPAVTKEK